MGLPRLPPMSPPQLLEVLQCDLKGTQKAHDMDGLKQILAGIQWADEETWVCLHSLCFMYADKFR